MVGLVFKLSRDKMIYGKCNLMVGILYRSIFEDLIKDFLNEKF